MTELKQRLLKTELARLGFPDAQYERYSDLEDAMIVNPSDEHLIRIAGNGEIFYNGIHDHLVRNVILPVSERVNEISAAWENAHNAPFESAADFRILVEHNDVVLATCDSGKHEFEFVT